MFTSYVFAATLIVVIAIAVILKLRSRRTNPIAQPPAKTAGGHFPVAHPVENDEDATLVYLRSSQAPIPADKSKREGSSLRHSSGVRLLCLSGRSKGTSYMIIPTGVTLGRHPTCDIVIDDPRVSTKHAWIGFVGGKVVLRDLESTNGTFLNAQIQSSISEAELCSGDTIFFGGHKGNQFRFMAD